MKKKKNISIEQLRKHLNDKGLDEQVLIENRFTEKGKEVLNEILFHYTDAQLTKDGVNIEIRNENDQKECIEIPNSPKDFSDYTNLQEFANFMDSLIDLNNKAIEQTERAKNLVENLSEEHAFTFHSINQRAYGEVDRLNQIRKKRELTLADLHSESLEILTRFHEMINALDNTAKQRLEELDQLNKQSKEQER